MIKCIKYSKEMITPVTVLIMVDDCDLIGSYTWEQAKAQIGLLNSLKYKEYDDWRLPTKEELDQMYHNKERIGGFSTTNYWSSSENDANYAWIQGFGDGVQYYSSKSNTYYVRAVRNT